VGRQYEAIIIGAGVIGNAIAVELSRRGLSTLSIDALPAAGYGSTSASSALVRFSYSTRAGVAMSYEGLHYWRDWTGHIGDIGNEPFAEFVALPMLMPKMADGHHERVVRLFDELNVPYEDLNQTQVAQRFSMVDLHRFGPPAALNDHEAPFWHEPSALLDGVIVMPEAG
jgi:sarcosine oxidase, subunit beta